MKRYTVRQDFLQFVNVLNGEVTQMIRTQLSEIGKRRKKGAKNENSLPAHKVNKIDAKKSRKCESQIGDKVLVENGNKRIRSQLDEIRIDSFLLLRDFRTLYST